MMIEKKAFRTKLRALRDGIAQEVWRTKSNAILHHLTQSELYRNAPCVFTYLSMKSEVDTYTLCQKAWTDGKQVAIPVSGADGTMHFMPFRPNTPLHKTKLGTREPSLVPSECMCPTAKDLFLVPGLAFDLDGNRCGYGGGFYDRFLAAHPDACPTALAFDLQMCPAPLPCLAPHDYVMQHIVTEHGWAK